MQHNTAIEKNEYNSLYTDRERSQKYMKWAKQGAVQYTWYATICININK